MANGVATLQLFCVFRRGLVQRELLVLVLVLLGVFVSLDLFDIGLLSLCYKLVWHVVCPFFMASLAWICCFVLAIWVFI